MIGNNLKILYRYLLNNSFYLSKNFWSSAEIINLINYFCCNLYCIVLFFCYAQYLILETVVLTSVNLYCIVLFFCYAQYLILETVVLTSVNLYCIVLFFYYAQYLILETVVLTSVNLYCIV